MAVEPDRNPIAEATNARSFHIASATVSPEALGQAHLHHHGDTHRASAPSDTNRVGPGGLEIKATRLRGVASQVRRGSRPGP